MANPEHLELLTQGVMTWNAGRRNRVFQPNLMSADLRDRNLRDAYLEDSLLAGADLSGAKLSTANLRNAGLRDATLIGADLEHADLSGAYLVGANLADANLSGTILASAELTGANLRRTNLKLANLSAARLVGADLTEASLCLADLKVASLSCADFTNVLLGYTTFVHNDLSEVKGLESIEHSAPSGIGIDTLNKSLGHIPEVFLRGCGLTDWEVESAKLYQPELSNEEITDVLYRVHDLRAHQAIQISPLFISYNHTDSLFVDEMETGLNKKGIRSWRDVHHATAGRLERQIDRAIRLNPTVLLILSEHSIQSDWVQHEARLARKLEVETKRDVLCPLALDDSWKSCDWPERLREQIMEYHILDFSGWKNRDNFRGMFGRLLDGLDLFYK